MDAGLLTTRLQSGWLVVSLSRGLTSNSAFVDEAARFRGIMRKFVQGVVEIRSFKLGALGHGAGGQGGWSGQESGGAGGERAKSKERGAGTRD